MGKKDKKYKKKYKAVKHPTNVQTAKAQAVKANFDKRVMKAGALIPFTPSTTEIGTYDKKKSDWQASLARLSMMQDSHDMQSQLAKLKQAETEMKMTLKNYKMHEQFREKFGSRAEQVFDVGMNLVSELATGYGNYKTKLLEAQRALQEIDPEGVGVAYPEGVGRAGVAQAEHNLQIQPYDSPFQTDFSAGWLPPAPPLPAAPNFSGISNLQRTVSEPSRKPMGAELTRSIALKPAPESGEMAKVEGEMSKPVPKFDIESKVYYTADGIPFNVEVRNNKAVFFHEAINYPYPVRDTDHLIEMLDQHNFTHEDKRDIMERWQKRGQYKSPHDETDLQLKYPHGLPERMRYEHPLNMWPYEVKVIPKKGIKFRQVGEGPDSPYFRRFNKFDDEVLYELRAQNFQTPEIKHIYETFRQRPWNDTTFAQKSRLWDAITPQYVNYGHGFRAVFEPDLVRFIDMKPDQPKQHAVIPLADFDPNEWVDEDTTDAGITDVYKERSKLKKAAERIRKEVKYIEEGGVYRASGILNRVKNLFGRGERSDSEDFWRLYEIAQNPTYGDKEKNEVEKILKRQQERWKKTKYEVYRERDESAIGPARNPNADTIRREIIPYIWKAGEGGLHKIFSEFDIGEKVWKESPVGDGRVLYYGDHGHKHIGDATDEAGLRGMGALYRNVANDPKFHTALLLGMEGLLSGMANQEGVKGSIKHGLKNLRDYINQVEGDTIRTTQELELHAQREEAKAKREEAKEQREEDKAKRETTSYRLKMGGMGLAALGGTLTAAGAYPPLAPIIPVGQLLMWMGGLLSAGGEGYKTFGDHQDKQSKKGKKAIAAGNNNPPQPPPAANATGT